MGGSTLADVGFGTRTATHSRDRREEFVTAALALYEAKGITHTSVKDISESVGVTRSLFYHYFDSKEAVTAAIFDTYIEKYLAVLGELEHGCPHDALVQAVAKIRAELFDGDAFRRELTKDQNAALYEVFIHRVAHAIADYYLDQVSRRDAAPSSLEHPYENVYLFIVGMGGYVRTHPQVSNDLLADVVAQLLNREVPKAQGTL